MLKMKKRIYVLTLLLLSSFVSFVHAQKPVLGIKLGANFDKTQGEHLQGDFTGSFFGGGYIGVRSNKVKLQGDLLFSQSTVTTANSFGAAFNEYVNNSATSVKNGTFKISELHIPVTLAVNLIPKVLWISAGPQFSNVVNFKDADGLLNESKQVIKDGYVSGLVGAEIHILNVNVGARYIFGLTDRNATAINDRWLTNSFQVHAGFSFLK